MKHDPLLWKTMEVAHGRGTYKVFFKEGKEFPSKAAAGPFPEGTGKARKGLPYGVAVFLGRAMVEVAVCALSR